MIPMVVHILQIFILKKKLQLLLGNLIIIKSQQITSKIDEQLEYKRASNIRETVNNMSRHDFTTNSSLIKVTVNLMMSISSNEIVHKINFGDRGLKSLRLASKQPQTPPNGGSGHTKRKQVSQPRYTNPPFKIKYSYRKKEKL